MKTMSFRQAVRGTLCAGVLLALSAGLADARPVRVLSNVNLRQGPGTNFGILRTIPRGSLVELEHCGAEWCTVHWHGSVGYTVARNLALGGPGPAIVAAEPLIVEPGPVVVYGPRRYWGPRYYYGPRYGYGWRRW